MVTLGLLPPYTLEDIRAAHREKAKTLHPDRGGTRADFETLHEAYERAQEYVRFHLDRRQ
jgi:curved DNA-binding protein CbpA